ncbi:hypothetical protein O1611_g1758 [Lasiodiplodia mahajangana]|uniref:Uncharacterized protein n=1 Tax=Lasiodiplodia mahajangana TaxID=1108764 RepID=A0ACC2JWT5_9PEZI|nr:hypothetical protein O1611_g1758 [Lasiodiplodia mahajangana]
MRGDRINSDVSVADMGTWALTKSTPRMRIFKSFTPFCTLLLTLVFREGRLSRPSANDSYRCVILQRITASATSASSPSVAQLGAYVRPLKGERDTTALYDSIKGSPRQGMPTKVLSSTTNALACNENPLG